MSYLHFSGLPEGSGPIGLLLYFLRVSWFYLITKQIKQFKTFLLKGIHPSTSSPNTQKYVYSFTNSKSSVYVKIIIFSEQVSP